MSMKQDMPHRKMWSMAEIFFPKLAECVERYTKVMSKLSEIGTAEPNVLGVVDVRGLANQAAEEHHTNRRNLERCIARHASLIQDGAIRNWFRSWETF